MVASVFSVAADRALPGCCWVESPEGMIASVVIVAVEVPGCWVELSKARG